MIQLCTDQDKVLKVEYEVEKLAQWPTMDGWIVTIQNQVLDPAAFEWRKCKMCWDVAYTLNYTLNLEILYILRVYGFVPTFYLQYFKVLNGDYWTNFNLQRNDIYFILKYTLNI